MLVNLVYILLMRAFSSFAPITKVRVTPGHTFPDRQECTGTMGINAISVIFKR